jgi:hypothetical protein
MRIQEQNILLFGCLMRPVTKNGTVCGTALQSVVHRPQITLERRPGRNVGDHGEGTFLLHFHARWQLLSGCGAPGVFVSLVKEEERRLSSIHSSSPQLLPKFHLIGVAIATATWLEPYLRFQWTSVIKRAPCPRQKSTQ